MTTRVLDTADLATAFTQAQAGLAAAPAGSAETWVLGPGEFDLGDGISAGAPGRSLTLRGTATLTVGSAAPVAAPATGLDLTGADVRVDGLTLRVRSAGTATALRVRAAGRCELTDLNVDAVEGTTAVGVDAAAAGELSLLDVRVAHVGGTQDATGVVTACAGDVAVRGLTVDTVDGARACGAVIVAGREADWSGGRINAVRATAGGAVGLRVLAAPERAAIRLTDLAVAQVSGTDPGTVAEPAESWRTWLADAGAALAAGAGLPDWPATGDPGHAEAVAGLHICAPVPEDAPWLQTSDPGPVEVTQCVVERISGTAVQVTADLRNIELRGLLIWTAARAGHVEGERVLLAQSTIHRVGFGWTFGPCALTAADTLVTGVQSGPGVVLGPEAELVDALVVIATAGLPPWEPEPTPLPYHDPGPGGVPAELLAGDVVPDAAHDLRVDGALHGRAQPVPGDDDDAAAWVGALAPDVDTRCALRDPAPPPTEPAPAPQAPGPVVDYRARDARSLLALMTARARLTMPGWTPTGPADQTQMLLELFAERLDRIAYRQELALSEGTVATALERRSVEDHVRAGRLRSRPRVVGIDDAAVQTVRSRRRDAGRVGAQRHSR